jgi:hypothetical protein
MEEGGLASEGEDVRDKLLPSGSFRLNVEAVLQPEGSSNGMRLAACVLSSRATTDH